MAKKSETQPRVHEVKPAKTTAQAVANAKAHGESVNKASRKK
jgi:hypothetical protein